MEASNFDEANMTLGPPVGVSEDRVQSLRVHRGTFHDTSEAFVLSCYKVTQEELDEINKTGRVWLYVLGPTMPPVILSGVHPFEEASTEGH